MEPSPQSLESLFVQLVALDSIHPDLALEEMLAKYPEKAKELHSLHAAYSAGAQAMDSQKSTPPEEFVAAGVARQYEDRGQLGVGGGGEVRLVWDPRLRRELAMKILPKGMTAGGSAVSLARGQRFLNEARLTGSLEHPGVIPVHDMGVDEHDQPFFTMQRVSGRTFADLIDELHRRSPAPEDPWSLERTIGALQRVCETMAFAHSKGVLHRDLKPANLMVGPFGEVYVMDWGLAHTPDASAATATGPFDDDLFSPKGGDIDLTKDGEVLGTPSFMAPEQADGALGDLDQRADVYSLGAVLYHILTGYAPYREPGSKGDAFALLKRLRRGQPLDPGQASADAPEALLAICRKAMSRERNNRYPSAKILGRDLRAWSEGRVVSAHRTGIGIETVKWVQRNPAFAISLALASVIVLVGAGAFLVLRARTTRELSKSAYLGKIARIDQGLDRGWIPQVVQHMASIDPKLRGWEYGYLRSRLDKGMCVVGVHEAEVLKVCLSRNGRYLLSADADGLVALWDTTETDGKSAAKLLRVYPRADFDNEKGRISDLQFLADGSAFVASYWNHERLRMIDSLTGRPIWESSVRKQDWNIVSLSTDDQLIASIDADRRFQLLNAGDGSPVEYPVPDGPMANLCLVGSGPLLAYSDGNGHLLLSEGVVTQGPSASNTVFNSIVSDRSGKRLAALDDAGDTWVWDFDTPKPEPFRLNSEPGSARSIAFGPAGEQLAVGEGALLTIWDLQENRLLKTYEGHQGKVISVAWSADGSLLASGGLNGELRIWNPRAGSGASLSLGQDSVVLGVDTSATRVLVRNSGQILIHNLATGETETGPSVQDATVSSAAWDTDSPALFSYSSPSTLIRTEPGKPKIEVDLTQLGTGPSDRNRASLLLPVPNTSWLVVCAPNCAPSIVDKDTLSLIHTLEIAEPTLAFQLVDGNRHLVFQTYSKRILVNLKSGKQIEETEIPTDDQASLVSPEGSRVASICDQGRQLRIVDRSTGKELSRTIQADGKIQSFLWTKDGDRLISAGSIGYIYIWDAHSGELVLRLPGKVGQARHLFMSDDGRRILLAGSTGVAEFVSSPIENHAR